jgi:hypothetical protein
MVRTVFHAEFISTLQSSLQFNWETKRTAIHSRYKSDEDWPHGDEWVCEPHVHGGRKATDVFKYVISMALRNAEYGMRDGAL